MAIPLHLSLKDAGGADIRGSSAVAGREGSIEVLSLTHGMYTPTCGATGKLMAGRLHRPLTIEKEIDKASPVLYKAVAEGTPLSQAILRWCRINEAGREEEYFNMTMKNVRVVSVAPKVLNIKEQESMTRNHFEMVELRYEQITWTYRDGNLMFKDEWNERW